MKLIKKASAEQLKPHKLAPYVVWFTGLSGSGKSTLSSLLAKEFKKIGRPHYRLDGDIIRKGLCKDLGFSDSHRTENIRRVAEVSNILLDAGLCVIAAFITPLEAERLMASESIRSKGHQYIEVYVKASLDICEMRDPKGLYKKARKGLIKNFTGIDSIYEIPQRPDIILDTETFNIDECMAKLLDFLKKKGL
ncbi:MAG: adenylyl-sulfate kinase [Dissulfurimicrobium sp.]|uniref:adenylyl-sulfate kinase n=1 Tax=Dissulfurimicrobium sp. TaxID=2022436 RepID=UPI00404937B3